MLTKAKPPAHYTDVNAVLLSIDSATSSGAVLAAPEQDHRNSCNEENLCNCPVTGYETLRLGVVRTQKERGEWAEMAAEAAEDAKVPLIVVGEEWTRHGISNAAFISLCQNWGKWLAEFELAEVPKENIIRVNPNTWRAAVFGRRRPKNRKGLKRMAQAYIVNALKMPSHGEDVAEALCINIWGRHAAQVHAAVKKLRKAA